MSENINEVRMAIENIINLKGKDNSSDEFFLGTHYNEMLKFQELISKMNLAQHHRILEYALKQENEIPINYENLISFIFNELKYNDDFNILLTLIDIKKLKRKDLLKITKCPNFQESMLNIPKHYFIDLIENEHNQASIMFDEIKNEIRSISKKNGEIFNLIKLEFSNLFNQFVQESKNQSNSIIKSINYQVEKQIDNVHKNIDCTYNKINERINSIHKNIDGIYGKVDERINSVHKNIDEKSELNKNIINEKFNECNKNIENKSNSLVNEINEIKIELLSTSPNFKNNSISLKSEIKNIKDQLMQNNSNNNSIKSELKDFKSQLSQKINSNNSSLISSLDSIKDQLMQNNSNNNSIKSELKDFKSQLSQKINDSKSSLNTEIYLSKNLLKDNVRSLSDLILFRESLPITFEFDKQKSYFDGLFDYCLKKIGNPFKNKIFEITGNPEKGYEDVLYEICDNKNDRDYKSQNTSDSYLLIEFKNRSFRFKAIQIINHSENGNSIKNFTIEGSEYGYTWTLIGNFNDVDKWMPSPNSYCKSWFDDPPDGYYRFLKIKLKGINTSGNYHLCLKRIEIYGILK